MSFLSKFWSRRGNAGDSQKLETDSDYHCFKSDSASENYQQEQTRATRLHTQNQSSTPSSAHFLQCTPQYPGPEQEVKAPPRKDDVKNDEADDDGTWWFLSEKGSSDTNLETSNDNTISVASGSTPIKDNSRGASVSNYIQKEKILRKKAFNHAVLGGSIRFNNTFSDDSTSDMPFRYVHSSSSWGVELRPIEWTPPDSSYGAAVSAFGWLPKKMRKLAEAVFVLLIFTILVYFVIKIGSEISRNHNHTSGSGGGLDLDDDDHYLAHDNNDDGNDGDDDNGARFRFR
jgi:hypothetical protein